MKHLVIGIAIMLGAAIFGFQQIGANNASNELLRSGERGEAKVLRLETKTERVGGGMTKRRTRSTYILHCGLALADGGTRFGEKIVSYEFYGHAREGRSYPIRYEAANPENFLFEQDKEVNESASGGMFFAMAAFIAGGVFAAWGLVHNAATQGPRRDPEILRELP